MPVRIIEEKMPYVHVTEMKDGQIAKIIKWGRMTEKAGLVVQRYGHHHLIILGDISGNSWDSLDNLTQDEHPDLLVQILPPGSRFEIA